MSDVPNRSEGTPTSQPEHPPADFIDVNDGPDLDTAPAPVPVDQQDTGAVEVEPPVEVYDTGAMPIYDNEPMPHVEHSFSPEQFRCVRCGSTHLAQGYIVDYGERFEQVHFAPKRVKLGWLNSLLALRPWRALAKLDAVACRDCGAVLLTVRPDELRRAEHRGE